jgi:hypothetical protein
MQIKWKIGRFALGMASIILILGSLHYLKENESEIELNQICPIKEATKCSFNEYTRLINGQWKDTADGGYYLSAQVTKVFNKPVAWFVFVQSSIGDQVFMEEYFSGFNPFKKTSKIFGKFKSRLTKKNGKDAIEVDLTERKKKIVIW